MKNSCTFIFMLSFVINIYSQLVFDSHFGLGTNLSGSSIVDHQTNSVGLLLTIGPYLIYKPHKRISICPQFETTFAFGTYKELKGINDIGLFVRYLPKITFKDEDWLDKYFAFVIDIGHWQTNEGYIIQNDRYVSTPLKHYRNYENQIGVGGTLKIFKGLYFSGVFSVATRNLKYNGKGVEIGLDYYLF